MNTEDELDIRQYLTLLRKRFWLLAIVAVVCVAAAGAYSLSQSKIYQTSARVVLSAQQDAVTTSGVLSDPNAFEAQVGTQVQIVKSPAVKLAADNILGDKASQVISVSAAGVTNTRLLEISVQSKSPSIAADAANAYTKAYLDNRTDAAVNSVLSIGNSVQAKQQQLQQQIDELNEQPGGLTDSTVQARVAALQAQVDQLQNQYTTVQAQATVRSSGADLLANANVPVEPVSPKPIRNMAVALVLGLLLGVGLILLLERLDDRIRTEEDIERFAPGLAQLGSIPRVTDWKDEAEAKAVTLLEPQSPAAEAYRRLRTSIEFVGLDHPMHVIEVTSATAGEGKSTTVANLATALAWSGKRVIIVAADLRRPRVHDFFGISNAEGFTSILLSGADVTSILQKADIREGNGTVHVLPTGPLPPNPAELLGGQSVRGLFQLLRQHADYVLIDSPPILPVADPLVLSSYADGIIIVAGADKLRRKQFDRAMTLISQAKAPVVGLVLNGVSAHASYYRYDQYYNVSKPSKEAPAAKVPVAEEPVAEEPAAEAPVAIEVLAAEVPVDVSVDVAETEPVVAPSVVTTEADTETEVDPVIAAPTGKVKKPRIRKSAKKLETESPTTS